MKNKNNIIIGLIFVLLGAFWLLNNLNVIQYEFKYLFTAFSRLWPLILVIVGLTIIVKNKVINSLLWLLFFVILLVYGYYLQEKAPIPHSYEIGELESYTISAKNDISAGKLDLDLGAMEFNIRSGTPDFATIDSNLAGLDIEDTVENNLQRLHISHENFTQKFFSDSKFDYSLDLALNEELPWSLDIDSGAVNGIVDLKNIKLKDLDIDLGAGNMEIYLSDKSTDGTIDIDSGVSRIELNIPKEAGILLEFDGALNSTNISELDFIKQSDNKYITENYDNADSKYHINVDMGLGEFKINKF